jgi:hypothetical protein
LIENGNEIRIATSFLALAIEEAATTWVIKNLQTEVARLPFYRLPCNLSFPFGLALAPLERLQAAVRVFEPVL